MKEIVEGKARILVSVGKISKKLDVFFNPKMKLNRDISVAVLKTLSKDVQVGLPLAGSGARGLRFLVELDNVKSISFNDYSEKAVEMIKKNIELNEDSLNCDEIEVSCLPSDEFLLGSKGFDYIDIDPFGNPSPFLDSAVKRSARFGIFAVTATDTSALCGTYPSVCKRNYWAKPLRNELMHEIGLRILIRKVQLIAAQYDRALIPIYSYSWDHYMRVFFKCIKGKAKVNEILRQHSMLDEAGPLWTGELKDKSLAKKIHKTVGHELTGLLANELDVLGFYDLHAIAKREKIKIPKLEPLMDKIKKNGFKVSRTHFSKYGIKSKIKYKELLRLFN